jgi:hypothetical protein
MSDNRARSFADHIEYHIRFRQHRHMAGCDLDRHRLHALCREALQLGVNRAVLAGNNVPARLDLPCGAFDLLVEQVRHRHALSDVDELLLCLRQISCEAADAAGLQPYTPVRHIDMLEHLGLREFVLLALRGLVRVWRESRNADQSSHAGIKSRRA